LIQFLRERLTLILIALLPFHAFLVTLGTKLLAGPGHAPLGMLAIWKEGLLALILLIALVEIISKVRSGMRKFDVIDVLIVLLAILGFIISIVNYQLSIINFALGFKYDFLP